MEEIAAVRDGAVSTVGDVVPETFHDDIVAFLDEGSFVPGVLTLLAADSVGRDTPDVLDRAVGVELIYDGLRLTRRLAADPPWTDTDDPTQANIDILAADVLVARGFYLLAETEAATDAVAVVQSFGHDQTVSHKTGVQNNELEVDILELALVAGASTGGGMPLETDALARKFAEHYDDTGGFPDPGILFDTAARERIEAVTGGSGRPLNRND
ncbi:hypothetical protein DM867_05765 [Halosegnis rubeus]|jgi:hypothetical protein|uniref:Uncharacterized protein n=1 Tax=Halosegnis rubeus TaxID=2212850 RepID=A0A5N5U7R6_9EURY|nr:hypothetical protein [Halosegnis rubeus]KAB7514624.1 hypothetical protein DM867_05765 [Halosegnis rubeus]KAB7517923.1 hypothetical protein DMP03_00730 [Halosegnis rubeus]KAB7519497.1 hypothetical protein DP108_05205 [Halosegnis rubeus]